MKNRNGQEIRIVPSVAVFGVLVLLDIYLLLRYYDWQAGSLPWKCSPSFPW